MSLRLRPGHRVFVFSEYVDMRAGFDRLAMIVREKLKARLVDGDLYLFMGANRRRLKALCYDGTGLVLIAKRIEHGKFMRIEELESAELSGDELDWLLRGSVIRRTKFGEAALTKKESGLTFTTSGSSREGSGGDGPHRESDGDRSHSSVRAAPRT